MKRSKQLKRVALVTAPYHSGVVESAGTWLNVGFVYIAGALRDAGYEVDYYDAMALWHDRDQIRARLEDFRPDVVATSAFTAAINAGTDLLALAKEVDPETVTVIGNVHATFCFQQILGEDGDKIDFVVRGEGERTLPQLLDCLNEGGDLAKVRGIAYLREDGRVHTTSPAPFIQELDSLSTAWDMVEWEHYTYRAKPGSRLAIISSSRGCKSNCSFCSQKLFWKRGWRAHSAEHVVDELELLHSRHGVNIAMLADEIPTYDQERWLKILEIKQQREIPVELLMETRVDDIIRDEPHMDTYRKAGVDHIYVGVEAGKQTTLNLFRKGTKVEHSKRAIDLINGADIVSETSFVLGMPDETPESIAETVELAKIYNPDMAFFLAIAPWPYADLYPELKDHVAVTDFSKYNLVEPVVKPDAMTLTELEHELAMASKKFFMHKFQNLDGLSEWKRDFMLAVFDLLLNHSYLSGQMREMGDDGGKEMPPEVRAMLKKVGNFKRQQKVRTLEPIP